MACGICFDSASGASSALRLVSVVQAVSEWRRLERRQLLWHASISLPLTQRLPWLAISRTAMQINHEHVQLAHAAGAGTAGAGQWDSAKPAVGDRARESCQ